jgi:hypothetical protein
LSDDPRRTAFDTAAPADERYDAQAQLQKTYRPTLSDLIPAPEVQQVIDHIVADLDQQAMAKSAQVIQFPTSERARGRGMQSVYLDDLQIFASGDWYEKPSPIGFESLRQMVDQTPVLNAVILTRIRQMSAFCRPQEQEDQLGFQIRHMDKSHELTPDEEESTKLLTRFIQNSGWEFKPRARQRLKRDAFPHLMAKLVRDTLTMDAAPIETEMKRDRALGVDGLYAVDGATIRLCTEHGYDGNDEVFALQVVQGRTRTAYTYNDLIYVPRNPRTDVRLAGYGLGEPELLIRTVTGYLNAMTYNIKGFDENAIPRGMLHISGDYDANDLVAFKRHWNAMVKGINNAWTLPLMVSKDQESKASFERFGVEFNEMYFAKWMSFLTSIICAIYSIDPSEINFESFSSSGRSSLSGDDTVEKIAASKDKGLRPLMGYFESMLSDYVISEFGDKYVFRFVGLDQEDASRKWEKAKLASTWGELRAEIGQKATNTPLDDAPLNPSLVGPWMQTLQQSQQDFGQEPGQDGAPGMGGDQGDQGGPGDSGSDAGSDPDQADQPGREGDFGKKAETGEREGDFGKSLPVIYSIE